MMFINHYNTKSLYEYLAERHRGRGAMLNPHIYSIPYFGARWVCGRLS
jgi:hypothetical protein